MKIAPHKRREPHNVIAAAVDQVLMDSNYPTPLKIRAVEVLRASLYPRLRGSDSVIRLEAYIAESMAEPLLMGEALTRI